MRQQHSNEKLCGSYEAPRRQEYTYLAAQMMRHAGNEFNFENAEVLRNFSN